MSREIERIQLSFSRNGVPGLLIGSHGDVKKKLYLTKKLECKEFVNSVDCILFKLVNCTSRNGVKSSLKSLLSLMLLRWEEVQSSLMDH